MKRSRFLSMSTLVLTAAVCSHASATPTLVGTWTGDWKDGAQHEVRITKIVDGGAYGLYCTRRAEGSMFFFDITPDGPIVNATVDEKERVLKFARMKRKYTYTLADDDTLTFKFKRSGKNPQTLKMSRTEGVSCSTRITPRP